ncbi:MAG: hypothetical protein DVB25_05560 [Verrucomicrobia bacterium]|nr:MAG: hypothetical protein DVB25_05560 [Verrucomicrobiota bacterium]
MLEIYGRQSGNVHPITPKDGHKKLSWEATYKEMAAAGEDWSEWDTSIADGLDEIPWDRPLAAIADQGRTKGRNSVFDLNRAQLARQRGGFEVERWVLRADQTRHKSPA